MINNKFRLICPSCNKIYEDEFRLDCDNKCNSLLKSEYIIPSLIPNQAGKGLFQYKTWLPFIKDIESDSGCVVYKSEKFAKRLGLKNLWIAFNGYWPEIGAYNMSGTFKDLEAVPTIAYYQDDPRPINLATVGNTGRAFIYWGLKNKRKIRIIIPEQMLHRLWMPDSLMINREFLEIISIKNSNDYSEAIDIQKINPAQSFIDEGGARSIIRRDGMGTILLEYFKEVGNIPDYYFQAISSGTGAIAVYEAYQRLRKKHNFERKIAFNLSQCNFFAPIYYAWKNNLNQISNDYIKTNKIFISKTYTDILTNSNPPYNQIGGLREILDKNWVFNSVNVIQNKFTKKCHILFEQDEEIDITKESAVTVASLVWGIEKIKENDFVLLNITGGGYDLLRRDYNMIQLKADYEID